MIRRHLSLPLVLVAGPLLGQAPVIAPAASVLFTTTAPPVPQDTVRVDDGMPQGQGAFLGMLGGAAVGFLLAPSTQGIRCTVDCAGVSGGFGSSDPAKTRLQMAVVGGLVGLFVGSSLAGPHAPHLAFVPMTSADSLMLARRKGGRIGAVVGGLLVGGVAFAIAKQGQRDPTCDSASPYGCHASGGGFDGAPVLLATGAGALAGYLMGRSIPARRPNPRPQLESEHPRMPDTGMKWWQGAIAGGVLGGVAAPMMIKTLRLNEQGDGVPAVAFAPVGALLGLVIGGSLAQAH